MPDAGALGCHAAVDDGLDGGREEQIRPLGLEDALKVEVGRDVAHGIDALAVESVVDDADAELPQALFRCGIAVRQKAEDGVSGSQHLPHQHLPEQEDRPCLVPKNTDFHRSTFLCAVPPG